MKKIKILMLHLNHGGVEKQTIAMANALCDKYKVEIISFYKTNNSAYTINSKIKVKYLYDGKPNREEFIDALKSLRIFKIFKEGIKAIKILYLKRALIKKEIKLNDSDIYFSTRTEYGILLSKYGKNISLKLTQEHNFFDDNKYKNKIIKGYEKLDYVIVISKYHEQMYNEWFKGSNVKIERVENILTEYPILQSKLNNNAIISVGRLTDIKDFNSLINVMKLVVLDMPKLKLYLLGDGERKEELKKKISEYKLDKNIIMPGFVSAKEVEKYMLKSDLYIMTSKRECFPMVLLEAYSCGLPVISYDILTGPREIVLNEKTGYLIKDRSEKEMAGKIVELLSNKNNIKRFSENAIKESNNYNVNKIIKKWYKIFK